MSTDKSFSQGVGQWLGTAEVFDGAGTFLGNATDQRHVQRQTDEQRVRIDLSFVGPFKFAGHYTIADHGAHRLYEGPANVGYAETLSDGLIDANAYWPVTGLTQRFFLMVLPGGDKQVSLALMSRGEQLLYVVVGEYNRVTEEIGPVPPGFVNGTSFDLAGDPTAGRGTVLLHRAGTWRGTLTSLDEKLETAGENSYSETVSRGEGKLRVSVEGSTLDPEPREFELKTEGALAWVSAKDEGLEIAGSYSLSGGRALSGQFHHLAKALRVWRREVVSHDGTLKAVLHAWYRGGVRVGVGFGVLAFEAAP